MSPRSLLHSIIDEANGGSSSVEYITKCYLMGRNINEPEELTEAEIRHELQRLRKKLLPQILDLLSLEEEILKENIYVTK